MYKERELSSEEYWAAMALRAVPAEKRLQAAQEFAQVAEDLRERANRALVNCETGCNEEQRKAVWDALQFPRYRFFDVALPAGDWLKFAEDKVVAQARADELAQEDESYHRGEGGRAT